MAEAIVSCSRCQTRYEAEASSISTLTPLCPACVESGSAETRALSLGAPQLDDDELTPVLDTASCTGLEGRAGATSRFQLWSSRPRRTSWLAAGASLIAVAAAVGIVAFLGMTGPRDSHPEDASATAVSLSGSKGKAASPLVAEWKRQHREWQAAKGKPEAAAAEMTKQVEATSRQILAEEPDVVEVPAAMLEHFAATRQHADVARAAEILVAHDPRQSEARKLGVAAYIEFKQYDQADKLRRAGLTGDMALPRVELSTQRGKIVLELLEDEAPDLVAILVQRIEQGMFVNEVIREASPHWVGCSHPFDQGAVPPQFQLLPRTTAVVPAPGDVHMIPWFKGFTLFRQSHAPYKPLFHVARVVEGMETVSILQKGDQFAAKILNKRPHAYEPKLVPEDKRAKQATSLADNESEAELDRQVAEREPLPRAEITTPHGKLLLELFEDEAPNTVAHFIRLVETGEYNSPTFYQVLSGSSIMAGNFRDAFGYEVRRETNRRKHTRGSVALWRGSQPNTAGPQFHISLTRQPHLDSQFTVFGRFVEGVELLDKIKRGDAFSIKIVSKRQHSYEPVRVPIDRGPSLADLESEANLNQLVAERDPLPRAEITTPHGKLLLELFEDEAPNTVANFIHLAEKQFYDNLTFHRVIPDFVVQGGDSKGDGTGDAGYRIRGESNQRRHLLGSLAMARAQDRDSAGSQFYFCLNRQRHLDGQCTVFGRVIEGIELLTKIKQNDAFSVKILSKRPHAYEPEVIRAGRQ